MITHVNDCQECEKMTDLINNYEKNSPRINLVILPLILLALSFSSCSIANPTQEQNRRYEGFLGYGVPGALRVEISHNKTCLWICEHYISNNINEWKSLGVLKRRKQKIEFDLNGNRYSVAFSDRNDTIDRSNRIDTIYLWIDQLNDAYPGWNAEFLRE